MVGAIGIATIVGGLGQAHLGVTARFMRDFRFFAMSTEEIRWAKGIGRLGHAARAVVFTLFGIFLIRAALLADAEQVRGLDGTLQALLQQRYGPWLLGVVALGLTSFGVFSVLCVRWIRCWAPPLDET
jgi:hypothetical protein